MENLKDRVDLLVRDRGMRLGKAYKKANKELNDDQVTNLVKAHGKVVNFPINSYETVKAYREVNSCMKNAGASVAKTFNSITDANGKTALVQMYGIKDDNGVYVARCLVVNGRFYKTYGPLSHALETYLTEVGGLEKTVNWLSGLMIVYYYAEVNGERYCHLPMVYVDSHAPREHTLVQEEVPAPTQYIKDKCIYDRFILCNRSY